MRTKALLLTAAVGAVGIASSMAQAVYSVNIVGYVNKTLPPGLSMIANQLNATPNNRVTNLIPAPTGALSVSKFVPASGNFVAATYDTDAGWDDPTSMVLNPGQGAFVDNPNPPMPVTFVGEVQLSSTINIHSGLDIYSSPIPQAGDLNAIGFPAIPSGQQLALFKFNGSSFNNFSYDEEAGGWQPSVPTVAIGESFFIDNGQNPTLVWNRTFTVGP
jgi:hypothetical protein